MADNIYVSQSISGYNSSPPPDDGTVSEANRTKYATVKDKLADPVKTLAEIVDTAMLTAGALTLHNGVDQQNAMAGSLAFTSSELTISAGAVTPKRSHHTIDTEADAATDDLDTMATANISDGGLVILRAENTARTVVVKHEAGGAGQFHLAGGADYSIDDANKLLVVMRVGADWNEVTRSKQTFEAPDFTSSEQTVTVDSALDVAHGLTTIPTLVQCILRCKTANLNYAVGDEVILGGYWVNSSTDAGVSIRANTTNVSLVTGVSIQLIDVSSFNEATITTTSWKYVIKAWK